MDDILDRSDELHVEILGLLDGVPAYPGVRHEVSLVACGMALEHALSLRLLIESPLVSYTYSNGSLWPILLKKSAMVFTAEKHALEIEIFALSKGFRAQISCGSVQK